jgi:hypothetical protein
MSYAFGNDPITSQRLMLGYGWYYMYIIDIDCEVMENSKSDNTPDELFDIQGPCYIKETLRLFIKTQLIYSIPNLFVS